MAHHENGDIALVEYWVKKDTRRWIAGILAGGFAGIASILFAVALCKFFGADPFFPLKAPAAPLLGSRALEYGMNTQVMVIGFVTYEVLSMILGFAFAHFTVTNAFGPLFGMGLTWAAFSWVFIYNLFSNSFRVIFTANMPGGVTFAVCVVFGIALTSVAFFDRIMKSNRPRP